MRPNDITGLLQGPELPQYAHHGFRQGTIVTFDQATGHNTVAVGSNMVGSGLLVDLPILNAEDMANYVPGTVVILTVMKTSWAILGRVFTPGSAGLFTTAQHTDTLQAANPGSGFAVPAAAGTTLVSASVVPPPWANQAKIIFNVYASARNTTAGVGFLNVGGIVSGTGLVAPGFGGLSGGSIPAGAYGDAMTPSGTTATFPQNTASILFTAGCWTNGSPWTLDTSNVIQFNAMIVYAKV